MYKRTLFALAVGMFSTGIKALNVMKQLPLSIASWNVLHEDFYKRYAQPMPFTRMSLQERTQRFHDVLNRITSTIDIISFQEFGSLGLTQSFLDNYTVVSGVNGYLATAYKTDRFNLIATESKQFKGRGTGKGFLATVLCSVNDSSFAFGIINTHIPFARTEHDQQIQEDALRDIRTFINSKPTIQHWFLCGDLNMKSTEYPRINTLLNPPITDAKKILRQTCLNSHTALERGKLVEIDYVLHTPTITVVDCSVIPQAKREEKLLTHGTLSEVITDTGREHSSDHALVIIQCLITED